MCEPVLIFVPFIIAVIDPQIPNQSKPLNKSKYTAQASEFADRNVKDKKLFVAREDFVWPANSKVCWIKDYSKSGKAVEKVRDESDGEVQTGARKN